MAADAVDGSDGQAPATSVGRVRRPAAVACAWCGQDVTVPARGRIPRWCGTSCRHRAWEQRRAAESGRSATEVVERVASFGDLFAGVVELEQALPKL